MTEKACRSLCVGLLGLLLSAISASPAAAGDPDRPAASHVSFYRDVLPILGQSCFSCHRPEKQKGKLDLTTFSALHAGGKSGGVVVAGDPAKSPLVTMVSGDTPEMPSKGDPLTAAQVAVLARWVEQGATDDTPAGADLAAASGTPPLPNGPPTYKLAPPVTALAWSPDGGSIVVAGNRELLLCDADGSGRITRLPSHVGRITSLAFSKDGAELIAGGGTPGGAGQVDIWRWDDRQPLHSLTVPGADTLFGVSLSPDARLVAFGCADKTVRVLAAADGSERFRIEAHSDWVQGVCFSGDGSHLASAGRDKSLKTYAIGAAPVAEELNDPQEAFTCLARQPATDRVACGSSNGNVRVYDTTNLKPRTEQKRDPNQVKQLDHQNDPINAVAFSADGAFLASASTGEVRVYKTEGWARAATLSKIDGPVFSVAFSPDGTRLATGGYDGQVRLFDVKGQKEETAFRPFPLEPQTARNP